uniref:Meiotic nuclear divisions 1 homolog (S. cerevisiae) n=1 Tax=Astyanax mexicanus TaxID=7994 RepID=A0A8B9J8B8_ASTMX
MSVKEVLQSLVDDNMVDSERVGTSNYYWAFPSKALHARKHRLEDLEKQVKMGGFRKKVLFPELCISSRCKYKERATLQKELQSLKEQRESLRAEVEKYKECDPEVVEEMRKENITAKEAVARWTDNVFSIKSWAKKKFSFEDSRLDKAFGIPEDFDYLD